MLQYSLTDSESFSSFPARGGEMMSEDEKHLPEDKTEEQGWLSQVLDLVPLFELILHIVEFILGLWR
jgi:hypothetical protein